ncbi:MAG TPA: antibiotic biosynthesis monooxygenase family protein [Caulobacteraceae bacterium]|nr:antibiotic biosynthesis monooxygenase family protein [Caulobacteraceae bacterium]
MSLTLVNLFTVPPGEADAFEARFKAVCAALDGMPGFEGTELHRNAGVGDQSYAFVNIAKWESAEAWREALPKIMAQGQTSGGGLLSGGVVPKAALYESVFRLPKGPN